MIREVETSDLPAIAKLLKGLGYNTSLATLEQLAAKMVDDSDYKLFIDVEDDIIEGLIALHSICLFHRTGKIGRITSFVVNESYRGNRAGKMLLEVADTFFKEAGCTSYEAGGGMVDSNLRKLFLAQGYKALNQHLTKTLRR